MKRLPPRQMEALQEIQEFIKKHSYPPTVKELGDILGQASSATAHYTLEQLEKKGYIKREKNKSRAIQVLVSFDEIKERKD